MVLSREDAGAEQIFRNDGVKLIQRLLESEQEDILLSALRTLVGLCTGHQSRVSRLRSSPRRGAARSPIRGRGRLGGRWVGRSGQDVTQQVERVGWENRKVVGSIPSACGLPVGLLGLGDALTSTCSVPA